MKRTALERRSSRSSDYSTRFVVCIDNSGYPASLEVRKVYQRIADEKGSRHELIRVIDESGEDYLFPAALFVPIEVPEAALAAFSIAS